MKLNAYMVRDEVVKRIDGVPCLKEEIVAYPSPDDPFFSTKMKFTSTILLQIQMGLNGSKSKSSRYFLFSEGYKLYPETLSCWAAAYAFPEGSM